jgi:hypothetical protein
MIGVSATPAPAQRSMAAEKGSRARFEMVRSA